MVVGTVGSILVAVASLAGDGGRCSLVEAGSAVSVAQTITLIDVTLGAEVPRVEALVRPHGLRLKAPSFVALPAPRVQLAWGLPRLNLGWLARARISIALSLSRLTGSGCAVDLLPRLAWNLPAPASTPKVRTLALPDVSVSLLTPWTGLLRRLGEDLDAHTSFQVSTGVAMHSSATLRTPGRVATAAPSNGTPVAAPRVSVPTAPTVSVPTFNPPSFTRRPNTVTR